MKKKRFINKLIVFSSILVLSAPLILQASGTSSTMQVKGKTNFTLVDPDRGKNNEYTTGGGNDNNSESVDKIEKPLPPTPPVPPQVLPPEPDFTFPEPEVNDNITTEVGNDKGRDNSKDKPVTNNNNKNNNSNSNSNKDNNTNNNYNQPTVRPIPGQGLDLDQAIAYDYESEITLEDTNGWTQEKIEAYVARVELQIAKILNVTVPLTSDIAVYGDSQEVVSPNINIVNHGSSLVDFELIGVDIKNIENPNDNIKLNLQTKKANMWTKDSPILAEIENIQVNVSNIGKIYKGSTSDMVIDGFFKDIVDNTEVKVGVTIKVTPVLIEYIQKLHEKELALRTKGGI